MEPIDNRTITIKHWAAADTFNTLEEAVKAGKKALAERFEEIKEWYGKDWTVEEIAECEDYRFIIYEFDPIVPRRKDGYWERYVEWDYDHIGELHRRSEHKIDIVGDKEVHYETTRMPGDEDSRSGTHFKAGDFVTLTNDKEQRIYVVAQAPGFRDNWPKKYVIHGNPTDSGENEYLVGYFCKHGLYDHEHPHEYFIRRYDGTVPEDHPLRLLSMIFSGALTISDETWMDICNRKIRFDYNKNIRHWHDIPELCSNITGEFRGHKP